MHCLPPLLRKNTNTLTTILSSILFSASLSALADEDHTHGPRADSHAPISIMGEHMHKAGEFMISLRHMTMNMSGNVEGTDDISDEEIVTSIANNTTAMPPTLRIVPQEMTTEMQMLGAMYAPSDNITLMAMVNYLSKDMTLKTFQGVSGTTELGEFETSTDGLGDTKLGMLIAGPQQENHKLHFNLALSIPTGSIDEQDTILTPMNTQSEVRLPYAMQLGTGTHDLTLGATYNSYGDKTSWGSQLLSTVRMGENDAGYRWGDQHSLRAWWQYLWQPALSVGVNMQHVVSEDIWKSDENIAGPVQTADPQNYGGARTNAGISLNYLGQEGFLKGHRFAVEYTFNVLEDLQGVQMSMDDMWTVGYQYAF